MVIGHDDLLCSAVPTIQFEQEVVHVNETDVYVMVTLRRTGE